MKLSPLEDRIMNLVNYTTLFPYTLRPHELSTKFKLPRATVVYLANLLRLEVLGWEKKNERYFLGIFIKENPYLTASQISKKTGSTLHLIYLVAREIEHRFETKYTIKDYKRTKSRRTI